MSVAKVIELLAEGSTIEEAAESAVSEASKTLSDVKHVYISEIQGLVENGQVSKYRVNCKVTFVVKGEDSADS